MYNKFVRRRSQLHRAIEPPRNFSFFLHRYRDVQFPYFCDIARKPTANIHSNLSSVLSHFFYTLTFSFLFCLGLCGRLYRVARLAPLDSSRSTDLYNNYRRSNKSSNPATITAEINTRGFPPLFRAHGYELGKEKKLQFFERILILYMFSSRCEFIAISINLSATPGFLRDQVRRFQHMFKYDKRRNCNSSEKLNLSLQLTLVCWSWRKVLVGFLSSATKLLDVFPPIPHARVCSRPAIRSFVRIIIFQICFDVCVDETRTRLSPEIRASVGDVRPLAKSRGETRRARGARVLPQKFHPGINLILMNASLRAPPVWIIIWAINRKYETSVRRQQQICVCSTICLPTVRAFTLTHSRRVRRRHSYSCSWQMIIRTNTFCILIAARVVFIRKRGVPEIAVKK